MAGGGPGLKRDLKLIDVYSIATGGAISSGIFLLPGIAYSYAGPTIIAAYLASAFMVIPAMLSKAELASAMPRSGGTYYFLDRSMGPLVGTIGGIGTWITMGLKSTFALVGMGAYVALVVDIDFTWAALALAVLFTALNVAGTKETARLQRWLVYALVSILALFCLSGVSDAAGRGLVVTTRDYFSGGTRPNLDGFLGTVGLVIVSYAGLTKVAGVAEEIEDPTRNIILGMSLSLASAAVLYAVGCYVLTVELDPKLFAGDLTPMASAAPSVFSWMPGKLGFYLILVAATAAFASTANAGIMSASRYLLAMGRDNLIPMWFSKVARTGTPIRSVLVTGGFVVAVLLTLDVESIAKLASAFQLLMFAMVNVAVIVMRESAIEEYDPGFKSPLYPWTQVAGIFFSIGLIIEMGRLAMGFSLLMCAVPVAWFFWYAKPRVVRRGAILHWFERLGRHRFRALERELSSMFEEAVQVEHDHGDEVILVRVDPAPDPHGDTDFFVLPEGYIMERLVIGRRMSGRSIGRLRMFERFALTVVAVDVLDDDGGWDRSPPHPDLVLKAGDRLVVVGTGAAVDAVDLHREDEPTEIIAPPRRVKPGD